MKKSVIALFIITGLLSCSSESGKPTAAINGMFEAMKSGNLDEMKKFISRSDMAMIDAGEKFLTSIDPGAIKQMKEKMTGEIREKLKTVSYTLKNEKINGDKASLDAEITDNGKTSSHTFELVKEDGAWKISISQPGNEMFNSMKGNMGPDKGGLKDGIEKLKSMDPDSVKMLINKGLQMLDSLKYKKDKQ